MNVICNSWISVHSVTAWALMFNQFWAKSICSDSYSRLTTNNTLYEATISVTDWDLMELEECSLLSDVPEINYTIDTWTDGWIPSAGKQTARRHSSRVLMKPLRPCWPPCTQLPHKAGPATWKHTLFNNHLSKINTFCSAARQKHG